MRTAALRRIAGGLLVLALAGCAETGDFGRPKQSAWNDLVLPAIGATASEARGEHVSRFPYTDDEQEMRDRAWRLVMPAHEKAFFRGTLTNLVLTHILPMSALVRDPAVYARANAGPTVSPVSRYRRLTDDAAADRALLPPVFNVTARVLDADAIRARTLASVPVDANEYVDAKARIAENAALAAWICWSLDARIEAYRFALVHMVIEVPHKIAIESERAVDALDAARGRFCPAWGAGFAIDRPVRPLYGPGSLGEPLVTKG